MERRKITLAEFVGKSSMYCVDIAYEEMVRYFKAKRKLGKEVYTADEILEALRIHYENYRDGLQDTVSSAFTTATQEYKDRMSQKPV